MGVRAVLAVIATGVVATIPGSGANADDARLAEASFREQASCPGGRILQASYTFALPAEGDVLLVPEEPDTALDTFEADTGLDISEFTVVREDLGDDSVQFQIFSTGELVASVLAIRLAPSTWGMSGFSVCSDLTDASAAERGP